MEEVDKYITGLEKNQQLKQHLLEIGYHPSLWKQNLYLLVEVELKYNTLENHKNALLGCYGEYIDILKSMDVTGVTIEEGKTTKVEKLFASNYDEEGLLTIEEVEKRKNIAVEEIKNWIEQNKEHNEQQSALYSSELERIEKKAKKLKEKHKSQSAREAKKSSSSTQNTILFFARVNNSFFRTAAVCNSNVNFFFFFSTPF